MQKIDSADIEKLGLTQRERFLQLEKALCDAKTYGDECRQLRPQVSQLLGDNYRKEKQIESLKTKVDRLERSRDYYRKKYQRAEPYLKKCVIAAGVNYSTGEKVERNKMIHTRWQEMQNYAAVGREFDLTASRVREIVRRQERLARGVR